MRVLIDATLEKSGTPRTSGSGFDERSLISDLLSSELIQVYRYSDAGPPSDVEPVVHRTGVAAYPGWAIVHLDRPEGFWDITYAEDGRTYTQAAVARNMLAIAEADVSTSAYSDLPADDAKARRRQDAVAAQVAAAVQADIYITEREFLHKRGGYVTRETTICTVREGLALVGLYLRSQGTFCVLNDFTFNRGLYFWVGTRDLLPSAWRWYHACAQHSVGVGNDSLMMLAGSLLQRFDRALELRDSVHISLNQTQNNDLREDALSALDMILVSFMAAIDVAARVAHRVLDISGDEHQAAWQQKRSGGWWHRLHAVEPALANVVAVGTQGDDTLTIVRLLRNSVHGAALQGIAYVQDGGPQETLVGLPAEEQSEVLAAMDAVGGRGSWGARAAVLGRTHVDPGMLVERLFDTVLALLNELMAKTPVERLSQVALSPAHDGPPAGGPGDPFEPWMRQSIRWQLGL
jgi:hypothetical protein